MKNPTIRRRAFSLAEMLIALAITGTLLTATLSALDTSFKSYKITTEGASTNVISRIVMNRIMTMLRTGTEFGPYPADPLDSSQNPVRGNAVEFTSIDDAATGVRRVVRLETREQSDPRTGPFELWYIQTDFQNGVQSAQEERLLLSGVQLMQFTLEYDVGPRLRRATADLTVKPNDFQDASFGSDIEVPSIRLVSSVTPRRLD
ncbi:MAG: prepilin-type N-terminal cleavage/methylation domain-containing protein [Planctomycetes bacterium]|nr:prepilin-type N-terminal cleavage/methylation domain-containing protein [Planctomycetota bacterium]